MPTLGVTWVPAGGGGSGKAAAAPDLLAISDKVKRSVVQWHRARNSRAQGGKAGGKHRRSEHCGDANDAESQGRKGPAQIQVAHEKMASVEACKKERNATRQNAEANTQKKAAVKPPATSNDIADLRANFLRAVSDSPGRRFSHSSHEQHQGQGICHRRASLENGGKEGDVEEQKLRSAVAKPKAKKKATERKSRWKNGEKRPLNTVAPEGKAEGKHKRSKHCGEATDNESRGASSETNASVLGAKSGDNQRRVIKIFEERVEALKAYKAKLGHVNVKWSEDKSLATFCYDVRCARKNPGRRGLKLTKDRIAALDTLGFEWEPQSKRAKSFQARLEELKVYRAKHGHLDVKQSEDKRLAKFCNSIRSARRGHEHGNMKLTEERIASLDAIGFDWAPLSRKANKSFQARIKELKAYKAKHGNLHVNRSKNKSLYGFCSNIRQARRNPEGSKGMKLTVERIAALDALGFDCGPQSKRVATAPAASNDEGEGKQMRVIKTFEERLEDLTAYKAKHGHTNVKESEDRSLAQFCRQMRYARRNPDSSKGWKLTEKRITALDGLGFDWGPQTTNTFAERVEELRAYKAKHGHLKVNASENKSLAQFCHGIRYARKKSKATLTEERIAALDEIGFDWEPKKRGRSKEKIPPGEHSLTLPIVIHNREPFGAEVGSETTREGRRLARIVNVVAGSQAETAGLRAGDLPVSDSGRLSYDVFLQMVKGGVRPFTFQVSRSVNTRTA